MPNVSAGLVAAIANASSFMNSTHVVEGMTNEEIDEQEHAFDLFQHDGELIVMCMAALFMTAFFFGNLLHTIHISWIPESLVVIVLGALGAVLWRSLTIDGADFTRVADGIINKQLLNMFFLPIIIFEAGWSIRNKEFISQLPYILIFAVFGTVICMLTVAGLTIATRDYHSIKGTRTAFAYGALIAAVDPVATLATYAHLNVEPLLNILVMGESIINDAVAIVLFEVLNDKKYGYFSETPVSKVILDICIGVVGLLGLSILIGLGLGCFYSLVMRFGRMRNSPALAILFIVVCPFFTYHFAEHICGKSGIIAVLFCGMIMSATAAPHLSVEGALLTAFLLKQLASLADMAVFMFVGFAAVFSKPTGLVYSLFAMLFCLVGRALATFPLGVVSNCIKKRVVDKELPSEKRLLLSWRHLFMMWHAGLRGGIALVLTLSLDKWVEDDGPKDGPSQREVLRNATVLMICVFLLVFGGSTECCLKVMKIPIGNPPPMYLQNTSAMQCLYWIHRRFLKPALKGDKPKETHMHGSILLSVMEEAKLKNRAELAKAQAESGTLGDRMDLFGNTDPMRLQRGWTRGDPDQEGWLNMGRGCLSCNNDESSDDDEDEDRLESVSESEEESSHGQ